MQKLLGRVAIVLAILLCVVWSGLQGLLWWETRELFPVMMSAVYQGRPVCGRDGQSLAAFSPGIPEHVRAAFIAAVEPEFLTRPPVTPFSLVRGIVVTGRPPASPFAIWAARCLVSAQRDWRGRTLERAFTELAAMFLVEKFVPRSAILDSYLEAAYLGRGAFGVDAAARAHFDKTPAALSLAEAAYLAGLPKSPILFADDDRQGLDRRNAVLARMQASGDITPLQYQEAVAQPLRRGPAGK